MLRILSSFAQIQEAHLQETFKLFIFLNFLFQHRIRSVKILAIHCINLESFFLNIDKRHSFAVTSTIFDTFLASTVQSIKTLTMSINIFAIHCSLCQCFTFSHNKNNKSLFTANILQIQNIKIVYNTQFPDEKP